MIRVILIILWALILANLVFALPGVLVWPLKAIGVALAVAHLAEFFIFQKVIKAKKDGAAKSFFMTMIFGVAYIKNLK